MKFRRSDGGLLLPDHDMPRRLQPLCAAPQQMLLAGGGGAGGGDPDFASVSLLLHMDGSNGGTTFTDNSANAHTVTATGVTTSTAQSKWGGASATVASGTGNHLSVPDHASLDLGSSEFTIECWIYLTAVQTAIVMSKGVGTGVFPYQLWISTDKIAVRYDSASIALVGTTTLTTGVWYFVQARRRNTGGSQPGYAVFTLALDGVQEASHEVTAIGYTLADNSAALAIGNFSSGANFAVPGYIDDLRITKGVGRNFAVPTAAFPDS